MNIFLMPGESHGSDVEVRDAHYTGIPVFSDLHRLREALCTVDPSEEPQEGGSQNPGCWTKEQEAARMEGCK